MTKSENRSYEIDIDPKILELLGPSLYTNIYYVLAELIANAYDADAKNVYILEKQDRIIVEDDGTGMSYSDGGIGKYLDVAIETRKTAADTYTASGRRKMGRKGVGKLAALSVSKDVQVMTKKNNEKSGFVLSREVDRSKKLKPIKEVDIKFERVEEESHGTSIVMLQPEYKMHTTLNAIKKNLLKIFPLVSSDFKIHLIQEGEDELVMDSFDKEMIKELGAVILLGDEYHPLQEFFDSGLDNKNQEEIKKDLLQLEPIKSIPLTLTKKDGVEQNYNMEIKGWLGVYRSTRDRKLNRTDFPDNFISLLSNNKLGLYNLLPDVGGNRLVEVFVVGQLHVDLFEETELPDMALSNRQGYKTGDKRYQAVAAFVGDELLPRITEMRVAWTKHRDAKKNKEKDEKQQSDEKELRDKVEEFKETTSENLAKKLEERFHTQMPDEMKEFVKKEMNATIDIMGIKQKVDSQKRKILICHTRRDKSLADVIYNMLLFNNVPPEEIIYTSCDDAVSRIPSGTEVFDYLRKFFVDSYSNEKIYVLYVTSDTMAGRWGAVLEVGAGWITKKAHKIFNIRDHAPLAPLDIMVEWQTSKKSATDEISMDAVEFDKFVIRVMEVSTELGYSTKTKKSNEDELKRYVTID